MARVLSSPRWSRPDQITARGPSRESEVLDASIDAAESTASGHRLTIDDLFSDRDAMPPLVTQARESLAATIEHLDAALSFAASGETISADDEILHAIATCDRAFSLRRIGDGFGMIVQGCLSALENMVGHPVNAKHLVALKRLLRMAADEPYVGDDAATVALEDAEASGIRLEPAGTDIIIDWLNG